MARRSAPVAASHARASVSLGAGKREGELHHFALAAFSALRNSRRNARPALVTK